MISRKKNFRNFFPCIFKWSGILREFKEIIVERFSPRVRAIADVCTWPLFVLFTGTLLVVGTQMAIAAIRVQEKFATPVASPAYLLKIMVPVGAFLLLLQGIAELVRNLNKAFGKKDIFTETREKDIEESES